MQYNAPRQPFSAPNGAPMNARLNPQEQYYGIVSPSNYATSPGYSDTDLVEPLSPQYPNGMPIPPAGALLERFKPSNMGSTTASQTSGRRRSIDRIDMSDPVGLHLLVETAIGDSRDYEILSFEELEELKKEQLQLVSKIESVKRKLALESKVKDAAMSLQRLYTSKSRKQSTSSSSSSPKLHRRNTSRSSLEGDRKDSLTQSTEELNASTKKVEELSSELYRLESRQREVSTQLLRHTAGILQMTHKGPSKEHQGVSASLTDGITPGVRPDSPASIYTYENGRSRSLGFPEDGFDDRSLYRGPDDLDGITEGRSARNVGQRSHGLDFPPLNGVASRSTLPDNALFSVEKRIEELNDQLRRLISQANPQKSEDYSNGPVAKEIDDDAQAVEALNGQLDYLGRALVDFEKEFKSQLQDRTQVQSSTESRLQGINSQIANIINSSLPVQEDEYPFPPEVTGKDVQGQIRYMEEGLYQMEQQYQSLAREAEESRTVDRQDKSEQYEVVLTGLWQIILAGEEERKLQKRKRRDMLATNPDPDDGASDMSPDEDFDPNEPFNLQAFSTKVQWLYGRAATLREQQGILKRQIRQQRQLNSKSDAEREEMHSALVTQLDEARAKHASSERELGLMTQKLEQLNEEVAEASQKRGDSAELEALRKRETELVNDLRSRQERIEGLESYLSGAVQAERESRKQAEDDLMDELDSKNALISELEAGIEQMREDVRRANADLDSLHKERSELESQVQTKEDQANKAESELRDLESEVIRLQTEVTIARAELDGAYGSRAQRAAEANKDIKVQVDDLTSKNSALQSQLSELNTEIATLRATQSSGGPNSDREKALKDELEATLSDFEELTRLSVENERDRELLEGQVDQLRERIESLELQLSDEKVRWMGMKSPNGSGSETTSMMVLKNEFKKMMRDTRIENMRALRTEQEEKRKLEQMVRQLKREGGKGSGSALGRSALASPI